ncbi:MAG: NAD-dependent epimerase/dehydratase family protein [Puniceicoccales bacterium]
MKILVTGACGFVGSSIIKYLLEQLPEIEIYGIDNLSRPGSTDNWNSLRLIGVTLLHRDIRIPNDFASLPKVDWVIDAAANPSVLAGLDNESSSGNLMENNLIGTIHTLEYCKRTGAGLVLLSTSRVYSIKGLSKIPLTTTQSRFEIDPSGLEGIPGLSPEGLSEEFSTRPPLSLYGASKSASELLALEYSSTFDFPLFINRCGVIAGAGQFGRADQGIFAFWIHSWREELPLRFIGFQGSGRQVRDCLHPHDLGHLIEKQIRRGSAPSGAEIINASGGIKNSMSLRELSQWCENRFGPQPIESSLDERNFDAPHVVLNSHLAQSTWEWSPSLDLNKILSEIADFAEETPDWIARCKSN